MLALKLCATTFLVLRQELKTKAGLELNLALAGFEHKTTLGLEVPFYARGDLCLLELKEIQNKCPLPPTPHITLRHTLSPAMRPMQQSALSNFSPLTKSLLFLEHKPEKTRVA